MAFRTAANHWKSTANIVSQGSSSFTTSVSPKLKAYPYASLAYPAEGFKTKLQRQGSFLPVYVAAGFITLSASLGLLTAFHHMAHCPNVMLRKSRRETIPEVVEPEQVAEYGDRFVKQSFFRKIAHIQNIDRHEAIMGNALTRPVRVVSLKDVGVDVTPHG